MSEAIKALLREVKLNSKTGALYGYEYNGERLVSYKDDLGRLGALFVYGVEEFRLDWVPLKFATYSLAEAKEAVRALKNEYEKRNYSAPGLRIVRFEKNVEIKETR